MHRVLGCRRCDYGPEPQPLRDVTLRLRQGVQTWDLGTADADGAGAKTIGVIRWQVVLPAGARPGPAELVADRAREVAIVLR